MAQGGITTTIIGNIGDDPELRFTPSGAAVATFSVAVTPRNFNRATSEWEDGETTWVRCSAWRHMAEHVSESLVKGMRVIATGQLQNRKWQDDQGNDRWSLELTVDEVGPSLRYGTAKFTKAPRQQQGPPPNDPWGAPATGTASRGGGRQQQEGPTGEDPWGPQPDEPPF